MTNFALKNRHRCPVDGSPLQWVDDSYVCTDSRRDDDCHEWDPETIDTGDKADGLAAGDRIYRWWHTTIENPDQQPLTVVRVNRKTVTVRTDHGGQFRLPVHEIAGFYTEDET